MCFSASSFSLNRTIFKAQVIEQNTTATTISARFQVGGFIGFQPLWAQQSIQSIVNITAGTTIAIDVGQVGRIQNDMKGQADSTL